MAIVDPELLKLYQMKAQRAALRLEIKGMRARTSMYGHIKRTYGLSGSRLKVMDDLTNIIQTKEKELGL